jgi:RNA polymerase sigma-70 factor (ECF subfamily)
MRETDERRWSALMVSAQSGNQEDYRTLLQELGEVVHQFLCSRFGQHHFIEDCVQESLLAIHRARHTYDPKRPFRPWMFAIVRHKTIDILRKQRTRDEAADRYTRDKRTLAQTGSPPENGEGAFDNGLLQQLPRQHREILVMTKVIGYSIAETADRLSISQSAVKVRVHRAVGKLRHLLQEDTVRLEQRYPQEADSAPA